MQLRVMSAVRVIFALDEVPSKGLLAYVLHAAVRLNIVAELFACSYRSYRAGARHSTSPVDGSIAAGDASHSDQSKAKAWRCYKGTRRNPRKNLFVLVRNPSQQRR